MKAEYKVELYTGIRPTGDLTIANYIGAVKPLVELQKQGAKSLVFVADMHSLTDNEPAVANKFCREVVADYLALGLDPNKTNIYIQSSIAYQVSYMTMLLARHTSVSELLRVPTLKDKLKNTEHPETANALLFLYPVMMAADILLQRAKSVPVGEDQLAHMEVVRRLARDFNARYGDVFPIPAVQQVKSLRILSLKGTGKMSKSVPGGAIFLTDDLAKVAKKIKSAETATEGVMTDSLQSHITLAKELCGDPAVHLNIDSIISEHLEGKQVMGVFKDLLATIVVDFLRQFQTRRAEIVKDPSYIDSILKEGASVALANAESTLDLVRSSMK
ncbi:MAG: tryptophan--tRNA ligase [Candidatus Yonathbacteria bacterium RIFCSPLOWO2_01_FULL_47_33b]|uniref:Tryptophan--tRNA ligase n=1 Tax=Candidatus Yonathbacteria bacterium RIFCSPLOWO2_01_FULL_47_33b TaxID=1802727 RepID=A0A1G2SF51_9BACT|nr:MAG: tryptophan--tRNA ligase [Candidatus Yonathbacteria bacterium RIFCSPLOWO2_01_FULL_47_33b]